MSVCKKNNKINVSVFIEMKLKKNEAVTVQELNMLKLIKR